MKIKLNKLLTPSQKFQIDIATIFANCYKQQISDNIKRGIRAKKEREKLSTLVVNQSKEI